MLAFLSIRRTLQPRGRGACLWRQAETSGAAGAARRPACFSRVCRAALVVGCLATIQGAADGAWAAEAKGGASHDTKPLTFDIPAQPLERALDAYSLASRVHVLYDSRLAPGRWSAGVQGVFSPEVALQTLLAGTGLAVRYTTSRDVVVVPQASDEASDDANAGSAPLVEGSVLSLDTLEVEDGAEIGGHADYRSYAGIVQADIKAALDRNTGTKSGSYSVGVKLWVDHSGAILRSEIFRSTGDEERDSLISHALRSVTISKAPPPDMPQPVSVMIVARSW